MLTEQLAVGGVYLLFDLAPQEVLVEERVILEQLRALDRWLVQPHQVRPVDKVLPDQVALQVRDLLESTCHNRLGLIRRHGIVIINF